MAYIMRDSYTGFSWCGAALHLLTPENQGTRGGCLACQRRAATARRDRNEPHRRRNAP